MYMALSKGNRVNIRELGHGAWMKAVCGNANELGDTGGGPGKSSLFFLRVELPGIGLAGDRDVVLAKRVTAPVMSGALRLSLKIQARAYSAPCRIVPISASGLQGEQPLVDRIM
jgi:hypothetical protein